MPHQRPQRAQASTAQQGTAQPSARPETPQQVFLGDLARDVKALNSAVLVLGQKMQYLVRNEKILGRNLLVLNRKIEDLQRPKAGADEQGVGSKELLALSQQFEGINSEASRLGRSMIELRDSIEQVKINYAKIEDLKELKYVIDAINPLEFVTFKQLDQFVEKKLQEERKKK